jgi:hypothetical protein
MALNKCLVLVGLVMQGIAAALQAWIVLHPEQPKTVGEGVVIDIVEALSKREKWVHGGSLLFFVVGAALQVVSLFVSR